MKYLLFILIFGICNGLYAQKPVVRTAAKADSSAKIISTKVDTPENRWEGNVVKNHFLYDSIVNDTLKPRKMKAIKRKSKNKIQRNK